MQQSPDIALQPFSVPVSTVQVAPGKSALPQQPDVARQPSTESRTIPLSSAVIGSAGGNIQLIAAPGGAQSWPTTAVLPITYIPNSGGAVITPQILTSPARLPILTGGTQIVGVSPGGVPQLIAINQFPTGGTSGATAAQTIPMLIQIPSTAQSSPTSKESSNS